MIHLSKVSINESAIIYIDWESNSQVRVYFATPKQEHGDDQVPESLVFPADSEDALKLMRSLGR